MYKGRFIKIRHQSWLHAETSQAMEENGDILWVQVWTARWSLATALPFATNRPTGTVTRQWPAVDWSLFLEDADRECAISTARSSTETNIIRGWRIGTALIQNATKDSTRLRKNVVSLHSLYSCFYSVSLASSVLVAAMITRRLIKLYQIISLRNKLPRLFHSFQMSSMQQ